MQFPKYVVFKDNRGEYRFNLYSVNAEIILTSSEGYKYKSDCLHAISICQANSPYDMYYDRRTTTTYKYYFTLRSSGNYKDIGRSEDYNTTANRENGINAVKRDGKTNNIEDKTV